MHNESLWASRISTFVIRRFIPYAVIGSTAFVIDITILYVLTTYAQLPYYSAVPLAFLAATSLHYIASRRIVFYDSTRPLVTSYILFLTIVAASGLAITVLVAVCVEYLHLSLYVARVIVAGIAGTFNFLANTFLNFKVRV